MSNPFRIGLDSVRNFKSFIQWNKGKRRDQTKDNMPQQAAALRISDDEDHVRHPQQRGHEDQRVQHLPDDAVGDAGDGRYPGALRQPDGCQPVVVYCEEVDFVINQPAGATIYYETI